MIPIIIRAANASIKKRKYRIDADDAIHFVRTVIALSIYKVTPTFFFESPELFPLAPNLNPGKFKKVLSALNRKRLSNTETSEIRWDRPFAEDPTIREGEEAMYKVNRQFFLPNISILSVDDDHLRLSAVHCETIGLPRKNNPDKAFGPVSTGAVSLTSGLTLATRLAGRGENQLTTIRILFKNLFSKELSEQVKGTNLVALDRGYLSSSMIEYISSTGCSIIGTHKRGMTYPFTFGDQNNIGKRIKVMEKGAKMTYWAKYKNSNINVIYKALAYRCGQGRVATMFTTSPEVNEGRFIYQPKIGGSIPLIPPIIRTHMNFTVKEITFGQGGMEWHIIRAGLGLITSSVASSFFKLAVTINHLNYKKDNNNSVINDNNVNNNNDDTELIETINQQQNTFNKIYLDAETKDILKGLGLKILSDKEITSQNIQEEHLIIMNKNELKEICSKYGLSRGGNKRELITRIINRPVESTNIDYLDDDTVKNSLMKIWFMKPFTNEHLKMGKKCEPKIASKIENFVRRSREIQLYDVTEVGLVHSISSNYLATSVDRLAVFKHNSNGTVDNNEDEDDDNNYQYVTAIEIKCMTTIKTANEAIEQINQYDNNFVVCDFGSQEFIDLVWTPEYRTQCLHHVSTYKLNQLLFVVGSTTEIIFACLISFTESVTEKYRIIMNYFGDCHIKWYQNGDKIEETLERLDLHHAVDTHTVLFWRAMAKEIRNLNSDDRTRLTAAHEIIPHAVSLWNRCKGGQDVVSRQLKNVQIDFRKMQPRSYILVRQIMTQLLNTHLVYRI